MATTVGKMITNGMNSPMKTKKEREREAEKRVGQNNHWQEREVKHLRGSSGAIQPVGCGHRKHR